MPNSETICLLLVQVLSLTSHPNIYVSTPSESSYGPFFWQQFKDSDAQPSNDDDGDITLFFRPAEVGKDPHNGMDFETSDYLGVIPTKTLHSSGQPVETTQTLPPVPTPPSTAPAFVSPDSPKVSCSLLDNGDLSEFLDDITKSSTNDVTAQPVIQPPPPSQSPPLSQLTLTTPRSSVTENLTSPTTGNSVGCVYPPNTTPIKSPTTDTTTPNDFKVQVESSPVHCANSKSVGIVVFVSETDQVPFPRLKNDAVGSPLNRELSSSSSSFSLSEKTSLISLPQSRIPLPNFADARVPGRSNDTFNSTKAREQIFLKEIDQLKTKIQSARTKELQELIQGKELKADAEASAARKIADECTGLLDVSENAEFSSQCERLSLIDECLFLEVEDLSRYAGSACKPREIAAKILSLSSFLFERLSCVGQQDQRCEKLELQLTELDSKNKVLVLEVDELKKTIQRFQQSEDQNEREFEMRSAKLVAKNKDLNLEINECESERSELISKDHHLIAELDAVKNSTNIEENCMRNASESVSKHKQLVQEIRDLKSTIHALEQRSKNRVLAAEINQLKSAISTRDQRQQQDEECIAVLRAQIEAKKEGGFREVLQIEENRSQLCKEADLKRSALAKKNRDLILEVADSKRSIQDQQRSADEKVAEFKRRSDDLAMRNEKLVSENFILKTETVEKINCTDYLRQEWDENRLKSAGINHPQSRGNEDRRTSELVSKNHKLVAENQELQSIITALAENSHRHEERAATLLAQMEVIKEENTFLSSRYAATVEFVLSESLRQEQERATITSQYATFHAELVQLHQTNLELQNASTETTVQLNNQRDLDEQLRGMKLELHLSNEMVDRLNELLSRKNNEIVGLQEHLKSNGFAFGTENAHLKAKIQRLSENVAEFKSTYETEVKLTQKLHRERAELIEDVKNLQETLQKGFMELAQLKEEASRECAQIATLNERLMNETARFTAEINCANNEKQQLRAILCQYKARYKSEALLTQNLQVEIAQLKDTLQLRDEKIRNDAVNMAMLQHEMNGAQSHLASISEDHKSEIQDLSEKIEELDKKLAAAEEEKAAMETQMRQMKNRMIKERRTNLELAKQLEEELKTQKDLVYDHEQRWLKRESELLQQID
ncbi:hypothetical protein HK098_005724 [Nowakowskiella sp. JEL0407]|nr:hypothetical protein HK098_005724 [Nowakowskiella sp. JEL0407]